MKNPYEVLGIKETATPEEIKKAYRELVKQYHPDRYENNPLKDLAEEKLREINEAYDILSKKGNTNSNSYGNSNSSGYNNTYDTTSNNYGNGNLQQVRLDINRGNLGGAEASLNSISNRNAEWNFLMGIIHFRKGWHDSAFNYINTACRMDPSNFEYRQTLNQISRSQNAYRNTYYGRRNSSDDMCGTCMNLWMLDTCCECMGGDCISCI